MTEAESSNIVPTLKSEAMEQFPFKYPKLFTSILLHCGAKDIHAIRCCSIQVVKNSPLDGKTISGASVPAGVSGSQFPQHCGGKCFSRFSIFVERNIPWQVEVLMGSFVVSWYDILTELPCCRLLRDKRWTWTPSLPWAKVSLTEKRCFNQTEFQS